MIKKKKRTSGFTEQKAKEMGIFQKTIQNQETIQNRTEEERIEIAKHEGLKNAFLIKKLDNV